MSGFELTQEQLDKEDEECFEPAPNNDRLLYQKKTNETDVINKSNETTVIDNIKTAFTNMQNCKEKEENYIITLLTTNAHLINSTLDVEGKPPLLAAIQNKNISLCNFLLSQPQIKVTDAENKSAISWLKEECHNQDVITIARNVKSKLESQKKSSSNNSISSNGGAKRKHKKYKRTKSRKSKPRRTKKHR
jgi:hypothetical protein